MLLDEAAAAVVLSRLAFMKTPEEFSHYHKNLVLHSIN